MGSGFKDWTAGDVLTAADVDGYLMRQTVMTFADASARDTALSGVLDEGMTAYLEDNDVFTVYDGSSWFQYGPGKILQVVSATHTTQSTFSSSTPATTGLTATITPSSSSSKVLVMGSFAGCNKQASDTSLNLWIYRGASQLILCCHRVGNISSTAQTNSHASATYLDSPATTSATTYTIYGASDANTSFAIMNHTSVPTSTLTLMEVAA